LVDTIQTADKSYVSVSQIDSKTFLVRKIAFSGSRVWERILRLQVSHAPEKITVDSASLAAIAQTTDGGYVLAGFSTVCRFDDYCFDYHPLERAGILIKLRSNGTIAWKREYSEYSTRSNYAVFTSLVSTADGGVIVTGATLSSLILVHYTSNGTILWSKGFPDLPIIFLFSPRLVQTPNNSLMLVASVARVVNYLLEPAGALVIKVNDSGAILWKKSLQMPNLSVQTIAATSDNGIVLAGSCYNNCKQLFMVRLKADGSVQSKRRYSLQVASVGSVTDIIQTSDGGFAITGSVYENAGNRPNVFVTKIDSTGKASFQRTFRIGGSYGVSVFALCDGYLLFGSATDTIILKLDSQALLHGCDLVSSPPISPIPFGNLRINKAQINAATDISLGTNDLAGSSIAARRPESDLCP
jgi:outer membrane protein assembly factor BamB